MWPPKTDTVTYQAFAATRGIIRMELTRVGAARPVPAPDLNQIVEAILAVCRPAGIILFGSYARGDFHTFSDIDLLVVREGDFEEGQSRRRELGRLYRAVSQVCGLPKDIILFTRTEFNAWRHTTNHMVAVAQREGRVLYGKV